MRKKILAIFEKVSTVGGAEISNAMLLDYCKTDYEVKKVFFSTRFLNILPVNASLFFKTLLWTPRVKRLIEEEQPDILVTQQQLTVACHEALRKKNIPLISFVRDWWFLTPNREEFEKYVGTQKCVKKKIISIGDLIFCLWAAPVIKDSMKHTKVITVSGFVKDKLKQTLKIDAEIICPPVEKRFFIKAPSVKKKFLARTVLSTSRFVQEKGVQMLINAMEQVDGKLIMMGTMKGPHFKYCKELSEQPEIKGKVSFIGEIPHEQVLEYLNKSTCLAVPSLWQEPFGRSCADAMATGTPVIATKSGGMTETIKNQLISQPTSEAFAEKINLLFSDFSKYSSLSQQAQKKAEEYDLEKCGGKFLQIIKKEIK